MLERKMAASPVDGLIVYPEGMPSPCTQLHSSLPSRISSQVHEQRVLRSTLSDVDRNARRLGWTDMLAPTFVAALHGPTCLLHIL